MSCDGGDWTGGSVDMRVAACTLKAQGWPQIVLLADVGGVLYQAEGLPALLPVLTAAIAQRSGTQITPADTTAASKIMEGRFKGGAEQMRSADLASFTDLVRLGRFYNSAQNFAGAENAFRRAMDIETRVLEGKNVPKTLVEFARLNGITHLFVARPAKHQKPKPFRRTLVQDVVRLARDMQVMIVADHGSRAHAQ